MLDVTNLTAQEMMLNYTTNKNIVIEARESCRVPVPVERCPLFRNETKPAEDNISKFFHIDFWQINQFHQFDLIDRHLHAEE